MKETEKTTEAGAGNHKLCEGRCGKVLPPFKFAKRATPDGRAARCRTCASADTRERKRRRQVIFDEGYAAGRASVNERYTEGFSAGYLKGMTDAPRQRGGAYGGVEFARLLETQTLKAILALVHPDNHPGSTVATDVAAIVSAARDKATESAAHQ